jgi:uncharacterized membrane protein
MVSDKFRRQLQKEAKKWQSEGLINSSTFEQLAQRYQFDSLERDSQSRFIMILLGLGVILLGLGIITFVAANWQGWSRGVRVVLLLSLFIAVNSLGFWGWHSSQEKWQRLGKALLLLGALILGANLALMSQMFHQSGAVYELYLVWGCGVLAMAYGLQLTWLAVLAIALVGMGYWWGLPSTFSLTYLPILATILFVPLAQICQSRWVLVFALLAVVSSFEVTVMQALSSLFSASPLLAAGVLSAAISLPPLLLWASDLGRGKMKVSFHSITRRLSILFLAGVCYLFSFHSIWVNFSLSRGDSDQMTPAAVLVQVLIFGSLTIYSWWRLGNNSNSLWQLSLTSTGVAVASVITGLVAGVSLGGLPSSIYVFLPTVIYNTILFFLAIALLRQGLNQGNRLNFWVGLGLLSLQIFSRMLEYQTGLVLKSVVLVLCGFVIVLVGLWFESYLRHL